MTARYGSIDEPLGQPGDSVASYRAAPGGHVELVVRTMQADGTVATETTQVKQQHTARKQRRAMAALARRKQKTPPSS